LGAASQTITTVPSVYPDNTATQACGTTYEATIPAEIGSSASTPVTFSNLAFTIPQATDTSMAGSYVLRVTAKSRAAALFTGSIPLDIDLTIIDPCELDGGLTVALGTPVD
jgi:hypothetical protein